MDVALTIVVIAAVVVVSLLGAWALGRYRRDKVNETDAGTPPPQLRSEMRRMKDGSMDTKSIEENRGYRKST
ncbi:MAG: hypothetical protein U9N84_08305 [Actinomycetota bacterium]|nr:hypothetical protein [Actinomycetota bacterium]